MTDLHKNFAYSTVATAPAPGDTGLSLIVAAGDGSRFPAAPFNAVVCPAGQQPLVSNSEIVRISAIAADTFTIARQQEGSNVRTILVGDQIFAGPTAKTFTDIERPPRSLLDDDCSSAILPPGVTATAALTFDSTRLGRLLGSAVSQASQYNGPAAALNGPLLLIVDFEFLNAYATGGFSVLLERADTGAQFRISMQGDGNIVIYNFANGAAFAAGGIGKVIGGRRMRFGLTISDLLDVDAGSVQMVTAMIEESSLAFTSGSGSQIGVGTANLLTHFGKYAQGGVVIPAGTNITPRVIVDTTRQVELYRVRWLRGAP